MKNFNEATQRYIKSHNRPAFYVNDIALERLAHDYLGDTAYWLWHYLRHIPAERLWVFSSEAVSCAVGQNKQTIKRSWHTLEEQGFIRPVNSNAEGGSNLNHYNIYEFFIVPVGTTIPSIEKTPCVVPVEELDYLYYGEEIPDNEPDIEDDPFLRKMLGSEIPVFPKESAAKDEE